MCGLRCTPINMLCAFVAAFDVPFQFMSPSNRETFGTVVNESLRLLSRQDESFLKFDISPDLQFGLGLCAVCQPGQNCFGVGMFPDNFTNFPRVRRCNGK